MKFLSKIIQSFEYNSFLEFLQSVSPSTRYGITVLTISFSSCLALVESIFGINGICVVVFAVAMIMELMTGLWASQVRGDKFSSTRMSRFGLKLACYLIIIALFWQFKQAALKDGQHFLASIFSFLWGFSLIYTGTEVVVSIMENLAVIEGKPKDEYINRIREKIKIF